MEANGAADDSGFSYHSASRQQHEYSKGAGYTMNLLLIVAGQISCDNPSSLCGRHLGSVVTRPPPGAWQPGSGSHAVSHASPLLREGCAHHYRVNRCVCGLTQVVAAGWHAMGCALWGGARALHAL
jgi:hypothetical protein